jgi:hypothetical protein
MTYVTNGVVAFCDLKEHEVYKGKSTGRFSLVVTLDDAEASKLADKGIKVKTYEDKKQRKFSSKFDVRVVDMDNVPTDKTIPYGSKVRLAWADGPSHPEHGVPTYLDAVRVVELAEVVGGEENPDF